MKQFIYKLDQREQRPVLMLKNGLTALLDTGAYIPVWTDSEDILVSELGAVEVKKNVPLSGFGGQTRGTLYRIDLDVDGIIYPNLHIIANNELDVAFNLIISSTMFDRLIYQIDTVNHVLVVDIPDRESNIRNLRIIDKNGSLHVLTENSEA